MQNIFLKKSDLKNEIIDIVQFGSSVIEGEEPNDIDIAVIYKKISLKEQLKISQEIKRKLEKKTNIPIHIISYDLESLFSKNNFAKEGILFYGKSIIDKKYYSEKIGFTPRTQIYYSLKELEKKDKVRFNYLLNGKKGEYGLLKKYGGELVKPRMIEIKPEHETIFLEAMEKITKRLSMKKVLISEK